MRYAWRRLIYKRGAPSKFWEAWVTSTELSTAETHVRFGRVGSNGHVRSWDHGGMPEAEHDIFCRTTAKIRKGYAFEAEPQDLNDGEQPTPLSSSLDASAEAIAHPTLERCFIRGGFHLAIKYARINEEMVLFTRSALIDAPATDARKSAWFIGPCDEPDLSGALGEQLFNKLRAARWVQAPMSFFGASPKLVSQSSPGPTVWRYSVGWQHIVSKPGITQPIVLRALGAMTELEAQNVFNADASTFDASEYEWNAGKVTEAVDILEKVNEDLKTGMAMRLAEVPADDIPQRRKRRIRI